MLRLARVDPKAKTIYVSYKIIAGQERLVAVGGMFTQFGMMVRVCGSIEFSCVDTH
jgi:hypothetical protein